MCAETLIRQFAFQLSALIDLDVEEHDIRLLLREAPHDRSANSRRAAGDENNLAGEIGIGGGHGHLPTLFFVGRPAAQLALQP